MTKRTLLATAVAVLAIGGGTAGAIAAGNNPQETERAVLSDAADRLGVTAEELRAALEEARDAQLDDAVKAGDLTEEQADAIREHRDRAGTVLGFGPGPGFHHGPPPFAEGAAKALGLTEQELSERLRDGETLPEIAKAEGKDLADVRAAIRKAMREHHRGFGPPPGMFFERHRRHAP